MKKPRGTRKNPIPGTAKFDDPMGEQRLAELMLHISQRCESDPNFGATKLNKILWWSDFVSYAWTGSAITGVEYQRLGKGPAPKRLLPIRGELTRNQHAAVQERLRGNHVQKRLIPLRQPDYKLFTAEQIALVDKVIADLWDETATGVSKWSHGKAWEIAEDGQSIPYEAIFLSDDPIHRFDVLRTHELADQFDWERV